jgi:DEAD/DEAH box helicase domain-containing protein
MLHVGLLPNHKSWGDFLANLGWVVVDEAHTYRGVFGSHVANVLRRLRRMAPRLRRRAALPARLGDDRQPGRAGRGAGRRRRSS